MIELVRQNYKQNKKIFNNVKKQLQKELDLSILIDHVGSTALKNMYGKNIIDILIGAHDKEEFEYIKTVLVKLGYVPSIKSKSDIYEFFSSRVEETHSGDIHINLAILDTERYNDFIILRDFLMNNNLEARKYSDFKRKLISNGIIDRKEYKNVKSEYVSKLIRKAKQTW